MRVGFEPTNTEFLAQQLCQFAIAPFFSSLPRNRTLSNSFEDCRANPAHSQAIGFQCLCQESNLICNLRKVACASTTLHRPIFTSGEGGIRTHKHLFLKQAAQPLAYNTGKSDPYRTRTGDLRRDRAASTPCWTDGPKKALDFTD